MSRWWIVRSMILLLWLAMALSAAAQGLDRWWMQEKVAREVGISEAQAQQMDEIFQKTRNTLIDLRAELEKKEADLHFLVESPQVDLAKVEPALDVMLAARMRLMKASTMMMLRIRQLLNVQQWRRLQEIERRMAPPPPPPPRAPRPEGLDLDGGINR